ncbi:MAG: AI-2E family transporter [Acidobacteria bacterium]|nr:AI-2E family transporter [Acidobacteriota bacterium]MXZ38987.1 AI-2E family transporter [Holophagales bacterium]MYF04177.1 AI-2E family transporter [Holophagales bacterium]MYJ26987.1 AI-2E family transporter [Holophagales bacterium]
MSQDDQRRDIGTPMRLLLVAACVVVLVAGLRAASSIMIPFLVAIFIAAISLPVLTWLQQRLPMIVAVLGTILMDLLVLALVGYLVGSTANQVAGEMGEIQSTLTEWIEDGSEWLEERGVPVASGLAGDDSLPLALFSRFEPGFLVDFVNRTLRATTAALSSFLVISLIVIFTLFEAATFGPKVRAAFGSAGAEARFARAMHEIQHYMGIKTVISLATGLLIGIWVGVLGVEFAIFWGLVAFVLNFIPNLGSIIAAVPTTLLAMVQIGVGRALLVALGYLVVNMVIGNFIEPPLLGRRLGLSTLVVVLSLVFWGWVWGPVGMLLSVPLTMVVKILLENTEEFRWVAVLLGDSREAERLAPASGGEGKA